MKPTSGPCDFCKECNLSGSCEHGLDAKSSVEACVIDVFRGPEETMGFPMILCASARKKEKVLGWF